MKQILVTILISLLICHTAYADNLKVTCYCPESSGMITASGERVREGICATGREHFGDCALLWTEEGEFLGFYECLDIGGTEAIRNGYVIDVWKPSLDACYEFMAKTKGKVVVEWIEHPEG